jgi:glycosyltransferase involved in cell wall biosynthesis
LAHLFNKNRIILDLDDWEIREDPKYYLKFYPSSKAHYITRQMARRSILCIAASRFLEEFLLAFNKTVYYIPSGVDTELFRPSLNGVSKDKIFFSWIGTLHRKEYIENIDFALSCFSILRKKYSHIYFQVLGDGIYRGDLERIIAQYNDRHILLKDRIAPDRVPAYLNTIHIGLFPVAKNSKFNQAKSPTKLFEYMAMAKPTVSSAIGEPRYILRDGDNGFLAGTREEFAEKMERLIIDSALRQRMGDRARENVVEQYSLEVLGKRLHEILLASLA